MELINTAHRISECSCASSNSSSSKSLNLFPLNPAPPFIGRHNTKISCSFGSTQMRRFFNLPFEIWYFHPQWDFIQLKRKQRKNFPFSVQFFSIHYENVAGTTTKDMINQKKCKTSSGEVKFAFNFVFTGRRFDLRTVIVSSPLRSSRYLDCIRY